MKRIKPIEDWILWKGLIKIEKIILAAASIAVILCVCGSVFMRYVLKIDLFGIEEIITLLAMWIYWMGGVYGSYEQSHINADITNVFVKTDKGKRIVLIVKGFLTVMISGVFAYWSVADYLLWNLSSNTATIGLHIPYIYSSCVITISFVMMFLYFTYHFIRLLVPRKTEEEVNV